MSLTQNEETRGRAETPPDGTTRWSNRYCYYCEDGVMSELTDQGCPRCSTSERPTEGARERNGRGRQRCVTFDAFEIACVRVCVRESERANDLQFTVFDSQRSLLAKQETAAGRPSQ